MLTTRGRNADEVVLGLGAESGAGTGTGTAEEAGREKK